MADPVSRSFQQLTSVNLVGPMGAECVAQHGDHRGASFACIGARAEAWVLAARIIFQETGCNGRERLAKSVSAFWLRTALYSIGAKERCGGVLPKGRRCAPI